MTLVVVIAILAGFVMGYFVTTAVIVFFTIIAVILAVALRPQRKQEAGALIGVVAWCVLGFGTIAMWATHFFVTDAGLGLSEMMKYIIRQ